MLRHILLLVVLCLGITPHHAKEIYELFAATLDGQAWTTVLKAFGMGGQCAEGRYADGLTAGTQFSAGLCVNCPEGYFNMIKGKTTCDRCPVGRTSGSMGIYVDTDDPYYVTSTMFENINKYGIVKYRATGGRIFGTMRMRRKAKNKWRLFSAMMLWMTPLSY